MPCWTTWRARRSRRRSDDFSGGFVPRGGICRGCGNLGLDVVWQGANLMLVAKGMTMPKLVRLYIQSVAIGFGLSAVFLGGLIWSDAAGLRGLIFGSSSGYLSAAMLFMFNGLFFGGVQFAIAVMRLAEPDGGPRGGLRQHLVPIPIRVEQQSVKRGRR